MASYPGVALAVCHNPPGPYEVSCGFPYYQEPEGLDYIFGSYLRAVMNEDLPGNAWVKLFGR